MRRRTPSIALVVIAMTVGIPAATVQSAAGDPGVARVTDPAAAAALFKSPHDVMVRTSTTTQGGIHYFAYERTHRGLPVIGGDSVVVTGPTGKVLNTYTAQGAVIDVPVTTPAVGADAATATAAGRLAKVESVSPARLVVLAWGTPRLAWEVKLSGVKANGASSVPTVYVDASTGKVTESVDLARDGTGNGFYNGNVTVATSGSGTSFSMQDSTRPGIRCGGQNGATFTGADDNWGNGSGTSLETACVDVLYAVQKQWDMLVAWLGRSGIDGVGGGFPARVGMPEVNARWFGSFTNFGHSADNQRQATSIDVVAHEYGHAIFQTTPGGAGFSNENGGLNEGTGDIFGALTEHFANNPNDPPDFLVGEQVDLAGSGPIRNMFNPGAQGAPNCFSSAIPDTEVHDAAGPLDHWFYLLSRGSNPIGGPASPTCNGSTVTGIGIREAGQIFYGALLAKTSTWRYVDARLASIDAAVRLFGADSAQCGATKAAWNAVSVPVQAGEPTCAVTPPITLFYRAGDGLAIRGSVDSGGGYRDLQQLPTFGIGWTHIVAVGGGRLLFYRAGDGVAVSGYAHTDGGYRDLQLLPTFATGWTHIVHAGDGRLLFYRASDGFAITGLVDSDGGYRDLQRQQPTFMIGWTHIVPVGDGRLLFYRAGDGVTVTGLVDRDGGYGDLQPAFLSEPGRDHIVHVGGGRLLFYRANDGVTVTGSVDPTGGYRDLRPVFRLAPGWTRVVHAGGGRLLFYRAGDGIAATGSVDNRGVYADLKQFPELPRFAIGWTHIVEVERAATITTVPDLHGKVPATANTALVAAGLRLGNTARIFVQDPDDIGRVVIQSPDAGAQIAPGMAVDIVIGARLGN